MKKNKLSIYDKAKLGWTKAAIGVFICLLSIYGALSNADFAFGIVVAKFITWCISFLVGSILCYFVYFIIFLFGVYLILSSRKIKFSFEISLFGLSIMLVGALILISNAQTITDGTYLTFSNIGQVYRQYLLNSFPDVTTSKNCGIIGLIIVATINSGMTNIGSNVLGSIFLVIGVFFAFGKISIKFARSIIDYYKQNFGKKALSSSSSFETAQDVRYDTSEIKTFDGSPLKNQPSNEPLEEVAPNDDFSQYERNQETNKVEPNYYSEPYVNPNPQVYFSSEGLTKATFDPFEDLNRSAAPKNVALSQPVQQQVKPQEEVKPIVEPQVEQPKPRLISDFFTIPTKNEDVKEEPVQEEQNVDQYQAQLEEARRIEEEQERIRQEQALKAKQLQEEYERRRKIEEIARQKPVQKDAETGQGYTNQVTAPKHVGPYEYPSIDLLETRDESAGKEENIRVANARQENINTVFNDLGIGASIVSYTIGPSVTQYDIATEKNVSINGLGKYVNDISVRLGGLDCRFVPIVSGKSTSGLEIANVKSSLVNFKECVRKLDEGKYGKMYVPFGLNISGDFVCADLLDFPHMLVCGTTGSGKSIFMHSVIMSLIMRNSTDELKLIMVDPKRVEFSKYKEMPHLLCPPINDPMKAYHALNKLVDEMEARYTLFEETGVSNLKQYNQDAEERGRAKLPYIVLIVDEFADLMDTNRKCSEPIVRIGQKARAAGIHMIIATQRPSTNVITGTIKANIPVRVALSCSSYVDSMTILGEGGAEKLLGNGDMLVMCSLISKQGFARVQGAFVSNKEIARTVDFLKQNYEVKYDPNFLDLEEASKVAPGQEIGDMLEPKERSIDDKYEEVKKWVVNEEYTSISKIQRVFGFGFSRAGKIFEQLQKDGIVAGRDEAGQQNSKGRKVLVHTTDIIPDASNENFGGGSTEISEMDYSQKGE
ncbi:MAG: DUF87 domain-containing protein [Bacilli bacterium]|nr:DUF87 domain-containing protein [Bacilli bacterium]